MTRWTPELIAQIRALAALGYSAKQVSFITRTNLGTLNHQCQDNAISFQRLPASRRPKITPDQMQSVDPVLTSEERLRRLARADLDHEIAMARAEAATAPLFRGGLQ